MNNSKSIKSIIYIIVNKYDTSKMYVGYTTQFTILKNGKINNKRFYQHKYKLKNNIHYNKLLQDDYNKDSESFLFINSLFFTTEKQGKRKEKELINSGLYYYNINGNNTIEKH